MILQLNCVNGLAAELRPYFNVYFSFILCQFATRDAADTLFSLYAAAVSAPFSPQTAAAGALLHTLQQWAHAPSKHRDDLHLIREYTEGL